MISFSTVVLRLTLALVLGGLVGLERERGERGAGIRTHALVALGSCLVMIVSAFGFADILGTPAVGLDPSRIAAQVVSGIGFFGRRSDPVTQGDHSRAKHGGLNLGCGCNRTRVWREFTARSKCRDPSHCGNPDCATPSAYAFSSGDCVTRVTPRSETGRREVALRSC